MEEDVATKERLKFVKETAAKMREECSNDLILLDIPEDIEDTELVYKLHELAKWRNRPINDKEDDELWSESAQDLTDWAFEHIDRSKLASFAYWYNEQLHGTAALELIVRYHGITLAAASIPYEYIHFDSSDSKTAEVAISAYYKYVTNLWPYVLPALTDSIISPITRDVIMGEFNFVMSPETIKQRLIEEGVDLEDSDYDFADPVEHARSNVKTFMEKTVHKQDIVNIVYQIMTHDRPYYDKLVNEFDLLPIEEMCEKWECKIPKED